MEERVDLTFQQCNNAHSVETSFEAAIAAP
jgi:hypothetical protein